MSEDKTVAIMILPYLVGVEMGSARRRAVDLSGDCAIAPPAF